MSKRKTYFIGPGPDYEPHRLVQLGQIISDPKLPHRRLNPPLEPVPHVYQPWKTDYGLEKKKTLAGSAGVFAKALAILFGGIGVDVAGNISNELLNRWEFERLETEFIEPDTAYVSSSVQVAAVRDALKDKKLLGKAVYMVTGVKIARGPKALREQADEIGGEGKVALDATALTGIPVQAGPQLSFSRREQDSEWFGRSSDFVFAYRLRKIFVHRSGKIGTKEVTGGALQGHGDYVSESSDDGEDEELGEIESAALDSCDFGSSFLPVGFTQAAVRDDAGDEECQVVWPKQS